MSCQHHRQVGDNYGMTCADCGEILEGYGEWGGSPVCVNHVWVKNNPSDKYEYCIYCEQERIASDE